MFNEKHLEAIRKWFKHEEIYDYEVDFKKNNGKIAITIFLKGDKFLDIYVNNWSKTYNEYGFSTYDRYIVNKEFIDDIVNILNEIGFE